MNIGFMGMGKLGLPCALAMESLGYKVLGYDPSPNIAYSISNRHLLFDEKGADELLKTTKIELVSVERLVRESDLIFVAVQTPHAPEYEGVDVLPSSRDDFDYSFLVEAVINLNEQAESMERKIEVAVISTVLPGTMRGLILPLCSKFINLSYNPYFIAMGTVIRDFLNPEFSLIGGPDGGLLVEFYESIHKKPKLEVSYEEAELIKMSYNTFIGVKIMLANTLTEMCHKVGGDVDVVTGALTLATDRIISGRYMRGGMGDGGHCFPPGELIMTDRGPRQIETIEPGTMVLTIDGVYAPVVKRWERQYDGDLVIVQTEGMPPVRQTTNHPLYVREDERAVKPDGRRETRLPINIKLGELRPIEAGSLIERHHFAAWPILKGHVDRPDHATDEYCTLAGWYLAEGSLDVKFGPYDIRSGRISIHLHQNERPIAENLARIMHDYDPPKPMSMKGGGAVASVVPHKDSKGLLLRRGSAKITKRLLNDFGKGHFSKSLPDWVLQGDRKTQSLILDGMINGDGGAYCGNVEYNTTSPNLAFGVMMILDRLGITSNIQLVKARGYKTKGGFTNSGDYYVVKVSSAPCVNHLKAIIKSDTADIDIKYPLVRSPVVDGHRMRRIHKTSLINYSGPVYNLWVDHHSHTFVTSAGAQANCHLRDAIAMSFLSQKAELSHDPFSYILSARERYTDFLVGLIELEVNATGMGFVILGKSFKIDSQIVFGSPAILLQNVVKKRGILPIVYDPITDLVDLKFELPSVFFIATAHSVFAEFEFPAGSVVIDPFGMISDRPNVRVVKVGRSSHILNKTT